MTEGRIQAEKYPIAHRWAGQMGVVCGIKEDYAPLGQAWVWCGINEGYKMGVLYQKFHCHWWVGGWVGLLVPRGVVDGCGYR